MRGGARPGAAGEGREAASKGRACAPKGAEALPQALQPLLACRAPVDTLDGACGLGERLQAFGDGGELAVELGGQLLLGLPLGLQDGLDKSLQIRMGHEAGTQGGVIEEDLLLLVSVISIHHGIGVFTSSSGNAVVIVCKWPID